MKTEELYAEVPCRRCGKTKLKSSSFCPHCGHVQEETWLDRLRHSVGGARGEGPGSRHPLVVAIAAAVLAGALFLAYEALADGRYEDLVTIVVIVFLVIRAFHRVRKLPGVPGQASEDGHAGSASSPAEEADAPEIRCTNCGARIDADAKECPRCGTRFTS